MKRYNLSAEAQEDLDEIRRHLTKEGGATLAGYVLARIRRSLSFLAETPGAGHVRSDITGEPVKFWSVFSYMIVYDPAAKPIGVARVIHGKQDLKSLFRRHPPRV